MTKHRRRLLAVPVLLLAVLALAPMATAPPRIVAVGDVHGDLKNLQMILREAAVIDAAGRWAGGRTILVQTGDLVDRGPDSRAVLDFVMGLDGQANQAGGRLVALLGNHEAMNILGDLRYVTEPGFAAYADGRSGERRQAAWRQYVKWLTDHETAPAAMPAEADWQKTHPIGYVEQREAFGPRGRYGKWLRQRPVVAKVGDTLFVHGGVSPAVAVLSLDQINARVAEELQAFDLACEELQSHHEALPFFALGEIVERATAVGKLVMPGPLPAGLTERDAFASTGWPAIPALLKYRTWLLVGSDGPLWFRGLVQWSDEEGAPQVADILAKQGAARIVLGHTTQPGRIGVRWDGRVFAIDTGMLQGYEPNGRPSALEIDGSQITAIYADGRVPLTHAATPVPRTSAAGAGAR